MRKQLMILLALCLLPIHALAAAMPTVPPLETLPPEPTRILITAAGDCTLGGEVKSGIDQRFKNSVKKNGYDYFLASVKDIFSADDFTIVNLEGPLTTAGKYSDKLYVMRGGTEYARILSGSSVDIANLANNHTYDFGKKGYEDTLAALEAVGVAASGNDILHIAEKDGYKIGFVGYERWNHSAKDAVDGVKAAREQCDIVIASMHWGQEYHYTPENAQKKLGRQLIDAGADLVIGHHPHVIQGIEQYNGKYIIYSLGNFCFGGNTNPKDKDCYIFQQEFIMEDSGPVDGGIRIIPCSVSSKSSTNDYQPTPLSGEKAEKLLEKILKLSQIENAIWLEEK